MILERFEVPGLAHYSYLIGSNGHAAVIDPKRDIDTYLDYADANALKILYVLETHIHADYASGAAQLAAASGAELCLSAYDNGEDYQYQFPHRELSDGTEVAIGDLRLVAVHTPGHTPEHLSFLLYDRNRCGQPMSLFTGDFIFVGSLGRPDLLGEQAKQALAHDLYRSVRRKTEQLPDGVEIYPAHGAGSLCGAGMAQRPQSTLGYERFCNVYMQDRDENDFVNAILGSVPEFPDYYRRMKQVNSEGPGFLEEIPGGAAMPPPQFRDHMQRTHSLIVDLRRPEAFGGAHIPGAFNIGAGQNLSMWAAWVLPYERPLLLVGDDGVNVEDARRSLVRVGLDTIKGYLRGGMRAWIEAGFDQAHLPQISVRELAAWLQQRNGGVPFVLDVRSRAEWMSGHIESALHMPGGDVPKRLGEIPRERPVHVICGSGYRSSIVASILKRESVVEVVNVVGGMSAWNAQALPVRSGA
jgi:hydroxyacylglutathione hydrolase